MPIDIYMTSPQGPHMSRFSCISWWGQCMSLPLTASYSHYLGLSLVVGKSPSARVTGIETNLSQS
jgi:hypothetical protein